jgi:hypothetical protein
VGDVDVAAFVCRFFCSAAEKPQLEDAAVAGDPTFESSDPFIVYVDGTSLSWISADDIG